MKDNRNKQHRITVLLADGAVFALLTTLCICAYFLMIPGLDFNFYVEIIVGNMLLWCAFVLITINLKVFIISISAITASIFLFGRLFGFNSVVQSAALFDDFTPTASLFLNEQYGYFYSLGVILIVFVLISPYFILKRWFKLSFFILVPVIIWFVACAREGGGAEVLFLLSLPLLCYIFLRAHYNKMRFHKPMDGYLKLQAKTVFPVLLLSTALIAVIPIMPEDMRSESVNDFVEDVADNLTGDVSLFARMTSERNSIDDNYDHLGGNLHQTGIINFTVETQKPLYLRTQVFERYTGNGFVSSEQLQYDEFTSQVQPYMDLVDTVHDSYVINMTNYNSRYLPIDANISDIDVYRGNFSADLNENVLFDEYFIEGDRFEVEYVDTKEDVMGIMRTIVQMTAPYDEGDIPPSALGELPDTITDRTMELADSLGRYSDYFLSSYRSRNENAHFVEPLTDYLTALTVQNYLRSDFFYSKTPGAMIGDDFVDSFLFEQKRGYCTSFATSMYVLLRALDVPCRYVVGYHVVPSEGEDTVVVSDYERHAWVEVYIGGLGFITMEPTPSAQERTDGMLFENPLAIMYVGEGEQQGITDEFNIELPLADQTSDMHTESFEVLIISAAILMTIFAVVVSTLIIRRKYTDKIMASREAEVIINTLFRLLKRLGLVRQKSETVREFFIKVEQVLNMQNEHDQLMQVIKAIEQHYYSKTEQIDTEKVIAFRDRVYEMVKKRFYI